LPMLSDMPYHKIRVLSTRPLDQSIHEMAIKHGIMIDTISFIRTEPVNDEMLLSFIQSIGKEEHYIIFTSKNAVEVVTRQLNGLKPSWKIFCIDSATKELVTKYFGSESILGAATYGAQLAEEIVNNKVKEIIFFCGDQRRDELPAILKAAQISLKEVVVYKTIATPQHLNNRYDAIAFFSPSAVNSFFEINKENINATLFAIGETTANAIKNHTAKTVYTPERPGVEQLIRTIIEYYKTTENKQSS
jgi:uroporphyrinogen-III synthase